MCGFRSQDGFQIVCAVLAYWFWYPCSSRFQVEYFVDVMISFFFFVLRRPFAKCLAPFSLLSIIILNISLRMIDLSSWPHQTVPSFSRPFVLKPFNQAAFQVGLFSSSSMFKQESLLSSGCLHVWQKLLNRGTDYFEFLLTVPAFPVSEFLRFVYWPDRAGMRELLGASHTHPSRGILPV